MMGREYGGLERRDETVDLPVAIEPVSPRRSMFSFFSTRGLGNCNGINRYTKPKVGGD